MKAGSKGFLMAETHQSYRLAFLIAGIHKNHGPHPVGQPSTRLATSSLRKKRPIVNNGNIGLPPAVRFDIGKNPERKNSIEICRSVRRTNIADAKPTPGSR